MYGMYVYLKIDVVAVTAARLHLLNWFIRISRILQMCISLNFEAV